MVAFSFFFSPLSERFHHEAPQAHLPHHHDVCHRWSVARRSGHLALDEEVMRRDLKHIIISLVWAAYITLVIVIVAYVVAYALLDFLAW